MDIRVQLADGHASIKETSFPLTNANPSPIDGWSRWRVHTEPDSNGTAIKQDQTVESFRKNWEQIIEPCSKANAYAIASLSLSSFPLYFFPPSLLSRAHRLETMKFNANATIDLPTVRSILFFFFLDYKSSIMNFESLNFCR